jgi:hypothetical protein
MMIQKEITAPVLPGPHKVRQGERTPIFKEVTVAWALEK